jgi:outer membrane immunogenic protein
MAALIASYPARAADLPAPTPYKAPPVMAPVAYNWSGLYFGANGGGVWTRNSETTTDVATGAVITTGTTNTSGFLVGGQIGFNWMFGGNWVGGVEADGDWVSDKNSVLSLDGSNRHDGKLEALGTGRARFGYAANNWLFYATGGVAWSEGQVTRTQIFGAVNAATAGTVETVNNTRVGWTAGGGVEVGITPNWTARAEYLFMGFDKLSYTFPLAGRTTSSTADVQVVRGALNYKFDWGAPITARY